LLGWANSHIRLQIPSFQNQKDFLFMVKNGQFSNGSNFSKAINAFNFSKNSNISGFSTLAITLSNCSGLMNGNAIKETAPPSPQFSKKNSQFNFIKKINHNFKFYNIQKSNGFIFIAFFYL
jgi:hypothetical protein